MRVGFVGLGAMGLPMAANLVKAGHRVAGFDLKPAAMKALAEAGGTGHLRRQTRARVPKSSSSWW